MPHIVVAMQTIAAAPDAPLRLTPLAIGPAEPPPDALGLELAWRTLDTLFTADPTGATDGEMHTGVAPLTTEATDTVTGVALNLLQGVFSLF